LTHPRPLTATSPPGAWLEEIGRGEAALDAYQVPREAAEVSRPPPFDDDERPEGVPHRGGHRAGHGHQPPHLRVAPGRDGAERALAGMPGGGKAQEASPKAEGTVYNAPCRSYGAGKKLAPPFVQSAAGSSDRAWVMGQ